MHNSKIRAAQRLAVLAGFLATPVSSVERIAYETEYRILASKTKFDRKDKNSSDHNRALSQAKRRKHIRQGRTAKAKFHAMSKYLANGELRYPKRA